MPNRIGGGRLTVTTAGTRRQLTAGTFTDPAGPIKSVTVQALEGNTGKVVVGGPDVVAALGTRRGRALATGEFQTLETDDLSDVWVDAVVNGEGVSFVYNAGPS